MNPGGLDEVEGRCGWNNVKDTHNQTTRGFLLSRTQCGGGRCPKQLLEGVRKGRKVGDLGEKTNP